MENIEQIAKDIAEGGFGWMEDGQRLLDIIDAVNTAFKEIIYIDERKEVIYTVLESLDDKHGWDAPRMSEEVERGFYKQLIEWRVTE